jgi:hypothetical protein
MRVGGVTLCTEGDATRATSRCLGYNTSDIVLVPGQTDGVQFYEVAWRGCAGALAKQRPRSVQEAERLVCRVEHPERNQATTLVARRDESWDAVCVRIPAGLAIVGVWHLDDAFGETVRATSELEDGQRYVVREMRELLRVTTDATRHALEARRESRPDPEEPQMREPEPEIRERPFQSQI